MTTILLLFGFVLIALAGIGTALHRLGRKTPDAALDTTLLTHGPLAKEVYSPIGRLFAEEDGEFLSDQSGYRPAMAHRLRHQRRRVLSLYLRQLRREFKQVWNLCRLLAPMSNSPEFGSLVTKQYLAFYGLYWVLQVRCAVGVVVPVRVNASGLVSSLHRLQQGAQQALRSLDQEMLASVSR